MPGITVQERMEAVIADMEDTQRVVGLVVGPMKEIASVVISLSENLGHLETRFDRLEKRVDNIDRQERN